MTPPLVLVINMARSRARWERIAATLRALDLPFHRIRAIDARRRWAWVQRHFRASFVSPTLGKTLTPAEVCCALSHLLAVRYVVQQQLPAALILEDDAIFAKDFPAFVREGLPHFLQCVDIVKLQATAYDYTSTSGPCLAQHHGTRLIVPLRPTLGAVAYAVTKRGAQQLLTTYAPLQAPLDHLLCYYGRHHTIPYGEIRPLLVYQGKVGTTMEATRYDAPTGRRLPLAWQAACWRSRLWCGAMRVYLMAKWVLRARLRQTGVR